MWALQLPPPSGLVQVPDIDVPRTALDELELAAAADDGFLYESH